MNDRFYPSAIGLQAHSLEQLRHVGLHYVLHYPEESLIILCTEE
jgi:hypothetical protein